MGLKTLSASFAGPAWHRCTGGFLINTEIHGDTGPITLLQNWNLVSLVDQRAIGRRDWWYTRTTNNSSS